MLDPVIDQVIIIVMINFGRKVCYFRLARNDVRMIRLRLLQIIFAEFRKVIV